MARFAYTTIGSNQLEKAIAFYDSLLGLAGIAKLFDHPSGGRVYGEMGTPRFAVIKPFDGNPASIGNGTMLAFSCDSRQEVDSIYEAALALGGSSEGAPGYRQSGRYFSYFRDLDGHKLCVFFVEHS